MIIPSSNSADENYCQKKQWYIICKPLNCYVQVEFWKLCIYSWHRARLYGVCNVKTNVCAVIYHTERRTALSTIPQGSAKNGHHSALHEGTQSFNMTLLGHQGLSISSWSPTCIENPGVRIRIYFKPVISLMGCSQTIVLFWNGFFFLRFRVWHTGSHL